jgi:chromosome segregation ATPase
VTASTLVIFIALSATCFMFGWVGQRVLSNRREADLQRTVYEAKGAVPQLESALRNRDGRINALQTEAQQLRERLTQVEAAQSQKDAEIVKRDREIRHVRSELQIVKEGTLDADPALYAEVDGGAGESAPADAAQSMAMKRLEARYESLKKGLVQRDDKIAELEGQLAGGKGKASAIALELEHEKLQDASKALEAELANRDTLIKDLQARLSQETEQKELLETLAKRRADANRGLKDTASKLEVQLPKMAESLKAKDSMIGERDATIAALRNDLAHAQHVGATQATTIAELEVKLVARREELARQAAATEALKQQQATQLDALKHQQIAQVETLKNTHALQADTLKHQHAVQVEGAKQKAIQLEQKNAALTNELAMAQQALANAVAKLREREGALSEQESRAMAADTKLREQGNTQSSLTQALRDKDFQIESLAADVARLNGELARAMAAAAEPSTQLESSAVPTLTDVPAAASNEANHPAELQFAAIHEHAARTERELHAAVREVKTLSGRLTELEAKRAALEALLKDKDASLAERARRIEDQQDQLARLEARIDERNQEIAGLKRARDERPSPPTHTTH